VLVKVAALLLLLLHAAQFASAPGSMNLRSSIAVVIFIAAAAFASSATGNVYTRRGLEIFGIGGALLLMALIQVNS